MHVYVMHLRSQVHLERAFQRVLDATRVASCTVEPDLLRVRFVAPTSAADPLVEEIYRERGLVWCSRHPLEVVPRATLDDDLAAAPGPRV